MDEPLAKKQKKQEVDLQENTETNNKVGLNKQNHKIESSESNLNNQIEFLDKSTGLNESREGNESEICVIPNEQNTKSVEGGLEKELNKVLTVNKNKPWKNTKQTLSKAIHSMEGFRKNEEKFGMLRFVNDFEHFSGIVKQRYSDFMVRERDLKGNILFLKNTEHIEPEKVEIVPECPIHDFKVLKDIEVFTLSEDKEKTMYIDVDENKEHRRNIHQYLKKKYKQIETGTESFADGSTKIKLMFKKGKNNNNRKRKGESWPANVPKFLHFTLFKTNCDTIQCVNLISRAIHSHVSRFSYAGTKDRRAATTQRVCAKFVTSKQLAGARLKNAAVGDFSYENKQINLGDLSGNEFTIVIRNVTVKDSVLNRGCSLLRDHGFMNYFGLQRFGTGGSPTHEIGKSLLNGNLKNAIDMILALRGHGYESEALARKIWNTTSSAKKAFLVLKNHHSPEGQIIKHLYEHPGDFLGACRKIVRNLRNLYLHSYQSYIWNFSVSERIKLFGFTPVAGDLVITDNKDENGFLVAEHITQLDIVSGTYSIYDVVLPLPGFDVKLPNNKIGDFIRELLHIDGLTIEKFRGKSKELSLSGKYRSIIVRPESLTWEIIAYDDYKISLIQNDYDLSIKNNIGHCKFYGTNEPNKCKNNADITIEQTEENVSEKTHKSAEKNCTEIVVLYENETKKRSVKLETNDTTKTVEPEENHIAKTVKQVENKFDAYKIESVENKYVEKIINDNLNIVAEDNDSTKEAKIDQAISEISDDTDTEKTPGEPMEENKPLIEGKFKALKLKFVLQVSCYATSALRELLIEETSFEMQQKLNDQFNDVSG